MESIMIKQTEKENLITLFSFETYKSPYLLYVYIYIYIRMSVARPDNNILFLVALRGSTIFIM